MWTTTGDLARFLTAVQDALEGRTGAILPRSLAQLLVSSELGKRGVVFGVRGSVDDPYFAHSGENAGFTAYAVAYERHGDGAVVMANGDRGFDLAEEIMRAVAEEYHWPDFHPVPHSLLKVDPKVLDGYTGTYEISPQSFFVVSRDGGHLIVQIPGQQRWEMLPDSTRHFFSQAVDVQITFRRDGTGRISEVALRQYGDDTLARRTK